MWGAVLDGRPILSWMTTLLASSSNSRASSGSIYRLIRETLVIGPIRGRWDALGSRSPGVCGALPDGANCPGSDVHHFETISFAFEIPIRDRVPVFDGEGG
jgi:hypothetical protein